MLVLLNFTCDTNADTCHDVRICKRWDWYEGGRWICVGVGCGLWRWVWVGVGYLGGCHVCVSKPNIVLRQGPRYWNSIGEYLNISDVLVLPESVMITFFRTCLFIQKLTIMKGNMV